MLKLLVVCLTFLLLPDVHAKPVGEARGATKISRGQALPTQEEAAEAFGLLEPEPTGVPRSPNLMLLYNPARASELSIFTGAARRFMDSARSQRPKFDAASPREKVQFLERYVFALCNSRLVNGMDLVFKMETSSENFCGYTPGMLSCFASGTCDAAARENAEKYIRGSILKFDHFTTWAERRKWQYRGDALKVAFYTRNTQTRSGFQCSTLKLINDNPKPVIVWIRASRRDADGRTQTVFSKPYYLEAQSTLPNLSDEDLFAKDTESRMRKLMAEAMAAARRLGINDIQAYSGTHERWNCAPSSKENLPQPVMQKIQIEFP